MTVNTAYLLRYAVHIYIHVYTRIYWNCQECQVYRSHKYHIKIIKRSLAYAIF